MLRDHLQSRLLQALQRRADTRTYPVLVGGVALAATLSMSVPFASLLISAVLLARRRWFAVATWSSAGAAAGAALLYLVFHHLGWNRVFDAYPDLVRSVAWHDATQWLTRYGVISLLVIAALPLPLTPALAFAAISRLPATEVIAVLWLGKWIKYAVYAWLTARFPERLLRRAEQQLNGLQTWLASVTRFPSGQPEAPKDAR